MSRDALIVGLVCVAAIALGAWLYFGGPTPFSNGAGYTVLAQGTASQISDRVNYQITSGTELGQVWQMAFAGASAPPPVDFSKDDVLAVFDGAHPSGGYGIAVSGIAEENGERMVTITHTTPGAACSVTEGQTSPFEFVVVPKSALPLAHTDEQAISPCP